MSNVPMCPRALRALRAHAPYVLYVPNRPTCPCAQIYFIDRKIKNIDCNEI